MVRRGNEAPQRNASQPTAFQPVENTARRRGAERASGPPGASTTATAGAGLRPRGRSRARATVFVLAHCARQSDPPFGQGDFQLVLGDAR
jgi:hypothetical protein